MEKERLVAFTDAVLAIIMTILVLELAKPSEPTLEAFWALRENFFAYFLSFFWLGSLWIALNGIWEKVKQISNGVIWWNLLLLFLASFMHTRSKSVRTPGEKFLKSRVGGLSFHFRLSIYHISTVHTSCTDTKNSTIKV